MMELTERCEYVLDSPLPSPVLLNELVLLNEPVLAMNPYSQ
jgi:hypothetical protein